MSYFIIIAILVVGAIGFTFIQNPNGTEEMQPATADEIATTGTAPTPTEPIVTTETGAVVPADTDGDTSTYQDGTYTTQVTYQTPARVSYLLGVTLTVTDDIVTDSTIAYSQGAEKDPNAQRFEAAYRTEITGQNLDTINLSRVGGASLTTGAFNEALIAIKADAQS